jgi:hypothetical protein
MPEPEPFQEIDWGQVQIRFFYWPGSVVFVESFKRFRISVDGRIGSIARVQLPDINNRNLEAVI